MNVALRFKSQSDTRCNLTMSKSDEHTKYRWFAKVYWLLAFLVVTEERENKVCTESTAFYRQREINHREKRGGKHKPWDYLSRLPLYFFQVLARGSVFTTPRPVWDSVTELSQNGHRNLWSVFISLHLVSNSFFSCFLSRINSDSSFLLNFF